jgi:hypothetical protein
MAVTDEGIWNSIDVNDEQPQKVDSPMVETEEGIALDINDEQSRKADSPMFVTEEGISIDANDEQP